MCVPVQERTSLSDTPMNKQTRLHDSSSSGGVVTPGLSTTMPQYTFNSESTSLLMGSSFNQYNNHSFFDSTEIDWSALQVQGSDALQVQEDMPSDLWFNGSTTDSMSAIQSPYTDNSSSFLLDPLPNSNSDAQELYLPDAYPPSLLPPDIAQIDGAASAPLPGAIVSCITPPLVSVPLERPPRAPSPFIQFPANQLLALVDGKDNKAGADGRRGGGKSRGNSGNKRGGTRKRKADDTLVGAMDGGASKLRKKQTKNTGEIAGEDATEATVEEKDAETLVEEAKATQEAAIAATKAAEVAAKAAEEAEAAQEAAIMATKAAEVAVKAAKEAKVEAAKPGQARRSGRTSTLPGRLQGGYTKPKRGSRAQKIT